MRKKEIGSHLKRKLTALEIENQRLIFMRFSCTISGSLSSGFYNFIFLYNLLTMLTESPIACTQRLAPKIWCEDTLQSGAWST